MWLCFPCPQALEHSPCSFHACLEDWETLLLLRNDLLLSFLGYFTCLFDFGRGGEEGGGWKMRQCVLNASEHLSNSARRAGSMLSYFLSRLGGSSCPRGSSTSSNCCVWLCLRFLPHERSATPLQAAVRCCTLADVWAVKHDLQISHCWCVSMPISSLAQSHIYSLTSRFL